MKIDTSALLSTQNFLLLFSKKYKLELTLGFKECEIIYHVERLIFVLIDPKLSFNTKIDRQFSIFLTKLVPEGLRDGSKYF